MLVFMRMLQTPHTEGDDNKQHNTVMNVRLGQLKTDDDMNKSCKVMTEKTIAFWSASPELVILVIRKLC